VLPVDDLVARTIAEYRTTDTRADSSAACAMPVAAA